MKRRSRPAHGFIHAPVGGATPSSGPPARGWEGAHSAPAPSHDLRAIPTVTCDPTPFDIFLDHATTMVWSATVNGPAGYCGAIVNDAFGSLADVAQRVGADGLYSVKLSTAVDHGWMYATVLATATIPHHSDRYAG